MGIQDRWDEEEDGTQVFYIVNEKERESWS